MTKLVYSINKVIKDLYIGNSYRDLTIAGRVYKKDRKFLGYDLKPKYYYTVNIPLIRYPFYDGEHSTNRILKSYGKIIKQELLDKIQEFKEQENRY